MILKTVDLIAQDTLKSLLAKAIEPTPTNYKNEFCKISKQYNLSLHECEAFKTMVIKLSKNDQLEVKKQQISSIEGLVEFLINKTVIKNIDNLAKIINTSINSAISFELDENLEKFSIKIGNSPSLLFEEDIQKEIEFFIQKRFEKDKKLIAKKTSDIAKLITLMGKYLNDAIHDTHNSSINVNEIKNEITKLDICETSQKGLFSLQHKLINAASNIQNQMNLVGENLKSNQSQVTQLEQKVQQLQDELHKTKTESAIDHLTGTLVRKEFLSQAKFFEQSFQEEKQNFAVIFFDLDHFKNINDTYTHDGGDLVLSTFAKMLLKETRKTDIVGRYGGEEFICLFSMPNDDAIVYFLSRIKNIIAKSKFVYKEHKIKLTFSAGVAFRHNHTSLEDTIQQADILLYRAKEQRDQIVLENGIII